MLPNRVQTRNFAFAVLHGPWCYRLRLPRGKMKEIDSMRSAATTCNSISCNIVTPMRTPSYQLFVLNICWLVFESCENCTVTIAVGSDSQNRSSPLQRSAAHQSQTWVLIRILLPSSSILR
ncbi:hypothetical protein FOCC_FOCC009519 [Frankliniella occidentalis]|nr:hypothetical protein FOCC_FOCC009519 [Frankliniella occidentalis]